jgi:hypothetical protein
MSGTLPAKLRTWAANRERKNLDGRLLRQAADEIEQLRERKRELEQRLKVLNERDGRPV